MKKNYFLFAFAALAMTVNAQFEDDMEGYDEGPLFEGHWSNWNGVDSEENVIISSVQSASGTKSALIGPGPSGPQDVLLLLGNKTSGQWVLTFNMFIPEGSTGYFNIQGETNGLASGNLETGVFNSGNINFENNGFVVDENGGQVLPYPNGAWFPLAIEFNLDDPSYKLSINGLPMDDVAFATNTGDNTIGAIDFFALEANNTNYIDDVVFSEGVLSTEDFNNNEFNVYPNPIVDNLNIQSTEAVNRVTVYDVLGKIVLSSTPGIASPSIDMSNVTSGVYLVNITTENSSKTIKVLK